MREKILLVDDEEDFLDILSEFLAEQEYRVACAPNGMEALDKLRAEPFDLLLSDINMPGMKGFDLLRQAADEFPNMKRALITAYDVNDYLRLAKEHDVGNIITKSTPFNFDETKLLIDNIITENVFGLNLYIDGPVHHEIIKHTDELETLIMKVINSLPDTFWQRKFRHGLVEALINAVYYGAKNERGDQKDQWQHKIALNPDEYVLVSWAYDDEKAGVAVTDQKGRLTKKDVLYWLERNTSRNSQGNTQGFFDKHGKGLFISRETNDRFIVNIKKNMRTEVILINYKEGLYHGHRPLWIHEF
jgi:CheY-like chemotaxis protein